MQRTVRVPGAKVALSTASCYPETCTHGLRDGRRPRLRRRRGDGLDRPGQPGPGRAARRCRTGSACRCCAIHAPCLLLTQRVWSTDPWTKLQRAQVAAERVGAATVVVHPPFRWQREYARELRRRAAPDAERDRRDLRGGEHVPVAGAQPGGRGLPAALGPARARLPGHHARPLAHRGLGVGRGAGRRGAGRPAAARAPRRRLGLEQGRAPGARPRRPAVRRGAGAAGPRRLRRARVVLEVNTRRAVNRDEREADLAEGLAFARLNLRRPPARRHGP